MQYVWSKFTILVEYEKSIIITNLKYFDSVIVQKDGRIHRSFFLKNTELLIDTDVEFLISHNFLVDEKLDEIYECDFSRNRAVFSDSTLDLTILPTESCNFRCVYCYESASNQHLTKEGERAIVKFVQQNVRKYRHVRLAWFGGEPLVRKDQVLRITKAINDICKSNGVLFSARMTTNAYELDIDTFNELDLFLFDEDICFEKYSYAELVELFEQNGLWIHRPQKRTALDLQWGGKLYDIHCPVLCIAGTDSRQGKFTLQVTLRKFLKKRNIKVSNFGTEPSSELFGFEGVYTFGYNAYMPYEGWKNILAVNHALHQLETESPDIIITGLQSRTIVPDIAAFKSYPIKQQEFISGCSPDTYILCINMDDSLIYIRRTIKYLESVFPSKVIALCMNDIMYSKGRLSLLIIQCMYMLKFGKKVFRLSSGKSLDRLSKHIIHYYK